MEIDEHYTTHEKNECVCVCVRVERQLFIYFILFFVKKNSVNVSCVLLDIDPHSNVSSVVLWWASCPKESKDLTE